MESLPIHQSPAPPGNSSSPLGMSAEAYVQACMACNAKGARPGALKRYSDLFRNGNLHDPLLTPWAAIKTDAGVAPPSWAPTVARTHVSECSEGVVVKFTQHVPGRRPGDPPLETESVLIPMIGKKGIRTYTLCLSSQVGCAMGCTFCQTAQMGLIRSLTPAEIVGQWFVANHQILADPAFGLDTEAGITNVVFMGMGEPLDNLDNVLAAIEVLTDHRGVSLAMSKITVSTVGRIDGIRKINQKVQERGWHRLGFAVSLNAPNDEIRSSIMPINRAMPMRDLRAAILERPIHGGFKVCLEYVLIPGVNDQLAHAELLGDFVLGRGAYGAGSGDLGAGQPLPGLVNLIPYNPREGSPWPAPDETLVDQFMTWLTEQGVYAKRRRTKGRDTMAACGQLGNPALRRKPRTSLTIGSTSQ
ncbi:MAG: 23S rRNA (adenine(2503)-C(2))-methyltransferase RlmN [Pyrinomonadaceae bacterium]|nr:23S rRNA (adenine(2503)-C(2))-methyltransferase RlmN [Phycisphaerales bacterium]